MPRPWTRKKTLDSEEDRGSEVLQMKLEDQVSKKTKFDFT